MSYDDYRNALIDSYYEHQLVSLVVRFDPNKPTVILLPGGMGSQLERTEAPYPQSPNVITDVIWMDLGIVTSLDALKTQIEGATANGKEKDLQSYVVAPHGPISFGFGGQTPYDELKDYAEHQGWNFGVFGFDWRRPIADSSRQFRTFIASFRDRVKQDYGMDPIPNLTIVCHSMGGMVCTDALRNKRFSKLGFHAVLTIATPFYGTSTHQDRYYVGMPGVLNFVYGARTVVNIVASLPGPYTLMFLPKAVYDRDGAKLGLTRYPQLDPNGNRDADPFDPAMLSRWPRAVKDHELYLARARNEMKNISKPVDANIAPFFFNVRSSLDKKTAVELLWNEVDGDTFVPGTTPSPLTGVAGDGDGTVPAWSAWHAHCRPKNRYELNQAKDHGTLLEEPEVLELIKSVVDNRKLPTARVRRGLPPKVASKSKVHRVVADWVQTRKRKQPPSPELFEKSVVRAIMANLIAGTKPRMVARKPKKLAKKTLATKKPKAGGK